MAKWRVGFALGATSEGLEAGGWHYQNCLSERWLWLQSGRQTGGPTRRREGDREEAAVITEETYQLSTRSGEEGRGSGEQPGRTGS